MEIKWPHQLTIVDIPSSQSAFCRSFNSSNLLELISAEIISSSDPRLSPDLPPTSVYASMDFGCGDVSQERSDRGVVRGLADDDWLGENIGDEYKEMARNLKVRVHVNPKFLPILADRAVLAKRGSGVTARGSERLGESLDTYAKNCEQGKEAGSMAKSNELYVGKDVFESTTKGRVDMLRITNKTANEQQTKERSYKVLSDANVENQDQLIQRISKVQGERMKQPQVGVTDKIGAIQNEPSTKKSTENLAADLTLEYIPRRLQKVWTHGTEDGSSNEVVLSDCMAVVKLEKESSQNDLFGCFVPEEIIATSCDGVIQHSPAIGVRKPELKSVGQKVVKADRIAKSDTAVDAVAFAKRPDKEKLKEEVLFLEKMVAEKKALQEERGNREKLGNRISSKNRMLQKVFLSKDKEPRDQLQKSNPTDRHHRTHAFAATTDKAISREHPFIPTDERHEVEIHEDDEVAAVSCFSNAEEKPVEDVVKCGERDNKRNRMLPGKELLATARPTSFKERDKEKTEDECKLPVVDQFVSSRCSEIAHLKKPNSIGLSKLEEPSNQLSRPKTISPSSNSDSRFGHRFDGEEQIYKEPQIRQSVGGRPNSCLEQSESNMLAKVTVVKTLVRSGGGSRFCTCDRFRGNDKVCDACIEKFSSASSDPVVGPLSLLSSHSANFSSSSSSVQSTGQKFETVKDTVVHGLEAHGKGVLSVKELANPASEKNESVLMHLNCLSPETQFESQFYDCFSVRSIHLEVIREWMKHKPLEQLICGQLRTSLQRIAALPNDVASDPLVALCLTKFCQTADAILEESSALSETTVTVKELPSDSTEMLANNLFEEVRQHLEFLSEKSFNWSVELISAPRPRNDQTPFDTQTLRMNVSKVSSMPILPKTSKLPASGTANLEAGTLNTDGGRCSVGSQQVLRKQEGDFNGSHTVNCSNKENTGIHEGHLPIKMPNISSQVHKDGLPVSEETEFRPLYQQVTKEGSSTVHKFHRLTRNKEQAEEVCGKNPDVDKAPWRNVLPRGIKSIQNAESKEEAVSLDTKEQGIIVTDIPKSEIAKKMQPLKRRHSSGRDKKCGSTKRHVTEQGDVPKSRHSRNTAKDKRSCNYLDDKNGLSEKTAEKQDAAYHADPKRKGKKKKAESVELISDLLLAKPSDSKIVLSHLLSEESALIISTNTDSNSSFQNTTVVEEGKRVLSSKKDTRQIVPGDNLSNPNQTDLLFFLPVAALVCDTQNIEQASVSPVVSKFDVRSVTSETSFNWAIALAMFEGENSECRTDVQARAKEVTANLKSSKPIAATMPKKTAVKSTPPLFKPPIDLRTGLLTDCSSPVKKFQSVNGDAVEHLAQDAFILFHSKVDGIFVKELNGSGLNTAEKTVLLPLEFDNKSIHYTLLSPVAVELYRRQVQDIDENSSCQPSNFVCTERVDEPSFKSVSKRKLSVSKRESGERSKKLREVVTEKNAAISTADKSLDVSMETLPVTCLSTDGCADEDRDGDLCDMYSPTAYSLDKCKKDLHRMDDDLYVKSNTAAAAASLKDAVDSDCTTMDTGRLLPSSKAHSIQQQFLSAKGPRFMQTFRQNQIAKRKSQKESIWTAAVGKIVHSKLPLATGSVAKPTPIGTTLKETPAVLPGDHVSPTSVYLAPSGAVSIPPVSSDGVSASQLPIGGSLEASCPIEAITGSKSSAAHVITEGLDAIPLPTSVQPEEPSGCIQKPSKAPVTSLEHAPALSPKPSVPVPCGILPSSCSSSGSYSVFISETVCIAVGVTEPSLLSSPPVFREDSTITTSGNVVPSFFVPPNAGPIVNPEWNCQYVPRPVEAPSSYAEQLNPPPVISCFASPRPFPMENVALMSSHPRVPHEMPAHFIRPGGDPRSWENVPPMQSPFPSSAGHPWRGPWSPRNMILPPETNHPHFCPPPGLNPSVMVPKRPLLPRPTGSRPGLLPHPGTLLPTPLFPPSCRDQSPVNTMAEETSVKGDKRQEQGSSAADIRMYVFNKDKPICKSIERFLEFQGARSFDPYNFGTLRNLSEKVCTVFAHEADLKRLHNIPNLLRLKRDIRVTFACYKDVMDVKFRSYVPLFPGAGLVVIDDASLISCKSESLQMLCNFMQLETKEKKAWTLIISPKVMKVMDKIRLENSEDSDDGTRLAENRRLLDLFKASGVVQEMSGNCLHPLTSLDYSNACRFLQTMHCKKFKHFIFITDFLGSHPDSQLFLGSGIDIMTIPEFLKVFVGKSVEHNALATSTYSTRLTGDAFRDSPLSTAIDVITFTC